MIYQAMKHSCGNAELDFVFVKRLSQVRANSRVILKLQVMTILGTYHLHLFDEKKLPPNYTKYLEMMIEISGHPSHKVSLFCLPFWNAFLSNRSLKSQVNFAKFTCLRTQPFIKELCRQLFRSYTNKIIKFNHASPECRDRFPYLTLDFASKEVSYGRRFADSIRNASNL